MDKYIRFYFELGLDYKEILAMLAHNHRFIISMRHFKRQLKRLHLYRRKKYTPIEEVVSFIRDQIKASGHCHGYRWMHMKCIQAGLVIQKEYVRILLQILDEKSVKNRKKSRLKRRAYSTKGPNYIWHLDSYDKLKPYGICISGCIDGFSRHLIWLKAGSTSSDPKVIAGYFLEAVIDLDGLPVLVRGDLGTENCLVAEIQSFLRRGNNDEHLNNATPFIYGTSQHNQRIESWWGILRKEFSSFWMSLFKTLKDDGLFSGDFLHKSLIQFCFLPIIQVRKLNVPLKLSEGRPSLSISLVNKIKVKCNSKCIQNTLKYRFFCVCVLPIFSDMQCQVF